MISTESQIAALIEQLPAADRAGDTSKFTGPTPELARKIATTILAGGRDSVVALASMIRNGTGDGEKNYKPGYALRAVTLASAAPGNDAQRKMFSEAVASLVADPSRPKEVRAFLIRELQLAGGLEVVPVLGGLLGDDELCGYAAQALTAIKGEAAVSALRGAVADVGPRSKEAIILALGALADTGATDALAEATVDTDEGVRLAAVWALARAGKVEGARAVIGAADKASGWARIQMTKACLLLAENLVAAGEDGPAKRIYKHLHDTRKDPSEAYIREAAARGLEGSSKSL